jgi:hypothetical protein
LNEGKWFRGNIHAHTTVSDGTVTPEKQAEDYRAQGYDFLALTDHNVMPTHAALTRDDFLMMPGWERDIPYGTTKCIHLVGLFPQGTPDDTFVRRERGNPETMSMQDLVDEMKGEGQFVVLAHPVWSRMEPEEIRALKGIDAIEVFNTGTERLCHAGRAEIHWDMLLREGKRVMCIACDDTHGKTAKSDRFGGWIMLNAKELTKAAVLEALRAGNYYASMGPELREVYVQDGMVHVECSPCSEIHVISYPPRGKAHYAEGELLQTLDYPLKGGERYVRVECVDEKGNTAWSNPIFLTE